MQSRQKSWVDIMKEEIYYAIKNLWNYGRLDMFNNIEIETTTICNRKCEYCPNSKHDRGMFYMDIKLYKKIINDLAKINYAGRLSPHFYGEPLCDTRIVELMEYTHLKLPKAKLIIFSNGDLLTPYLYHQLLNVGVDHFEITDHPPVKNNIRFEKAKYQKHDEQVLYNRGGLVDFGVKVTNCTLPKKNVVVDFDGNVILCCNDYFSTIKFGNLNEKSIMDVWDSDSYKNFRKNLDKNVMTCPLCIKCRG